MHDYVSRGVSPVEIDAVEHARLVARRGIVQASARMLAGEPNALSVADQLLALEDSLGDLFTALLERGARL